MMNEVIFKYPEQVFVGIATRKTDGTLNHQYFVLINAVPTKGTELMDRTVAEVITDDEILKDLAQRGRIDKMDALVVLGAKG